MVNTTVDLTNPQKTSTNNKYFTNNMKNSHFSYHISRYF